LLADDDARPGRMDRHPALPVRPLDDDLRHRSLLQVLHQRPPDLHVLVQQRTVTRLAGVPARIPGPVDAEAQADRIDFLTHQAVSSTSRTTIVRFENGFWMRPTRPRARGVQRLMTSALPTCASATTSESTSRS